MQHQFDDDDEKLPHEMSDEELVADEAARERAAAKLFGGITLNQSDDELEDELEDESGDLFEHISPTDYRSLSQRLADEANEPLEDVED